MTRKSTTTAIPLACLALLALAAFNPRILKHGILTEDAVVCLGYPDPLDSVKLRNTGDETATGEFTVYYTNEDGTTETLQEPITVEVFSGTPYLWSFPVGMDAGTYNCTAQWTVDGLTEPLTTEFTVSVLEVDIDLDANGDGVITVEDDPLDPNDDDSLEECQGALVGLGDTMPLRIDLRGGTAEHTATLTWTNPEKVQIYDGATVLNQKAQPGDPEYPQWNATELPRTLQVEALQPSDTPNDITFQLAHNASATPSGTIDTMSTGIASTEPQTACPDTVIVEVLPPRVDSISGGGVTCTEANVHPPWLYVGLGEEITFIAHPGNASRFPDGAPDWEIVCPNAATPLTPAPNPTLTVRFNTANPSTDRPILVRARCGQEDEWKTIKVIVCRLDLEALPVPGRTVPLPTPGRICLNAQEQYRYARYRAVIKPEGILARVDSTGPAQVTFEGVDGSQPGMLTDNDVFTISGTDQTGQYEVTLTNIFNESIQTTGSDDIFRFYLALGNIATNGTTPAGGGLPPVGDWIHCSTDGTMNHVKYERTSFVETDPAGFFDSSFQVKSHLKVEVTCEQKASYSGNTAVPPEFLSDTIWQDPSWQAVNMAHAVTEMPYFGKMAAFLGIVMHAYDYIDRPLRHVAAGVGSVYWAADGANYGDPARQNETHVTPILRGPLTCRIEGLCPDTHDAANIASSVIPYPVTGPQYTDHPIEKIYEYSGNRSTHDHMVGYVVTNKSSGRFAYRQSGSGFWWAGIDIVDTTARIKTWDISSLDFNIIANSPSPNE